MKLKKNVKLFFVVMAIVIPAVVVVFQVNKSQLCTDVLISFSDSSGGKYLDSAVINEHIRDSYGDLKGMRMSDVSIGRVEAIVDSLPQVKDAVVYKSPKGPIHIEVSERIPLCRLFVADGRSYYIDTQGEFMPVSYKTPARVVVANGNIQLPDSLIEKSLSSYELPQIQSLFELAKHINSDNFLSAQIQQIYIDSTENYILIPRVGNHDILLGKIENFEKKLYYLRYFYFNTLGNAGWNKYNRLNLSFDNQIVAIKE